MSSESPADCESDQLNGLEPDQSATVRFREDVESRKSKQPEKPVLVSPYDMDMLRGLEQEYTNTVKEQDIEIQARLTWARRSAWISVVFMIAYFVVGVLFFLSQTDWRLLDAMLFAIYTATSAGYGHLDIPQTNLFHLFVIAYILIGVAALAIMVAQVYQFFSLQASRAQTQREKSNLARKGLQQIDAADTSVTGSIKREKMEAILESNRASCLLDRWFVGCSKLKGFFRHTELGRFLAVVLPLLAMLLSGPLMIGRLEGWSFLDSLYFGVVSLTTVGYGDYVPRTDAGIIVTLFWLPCNIIFTSIYMTSVANTYFALARESVARIERNMRKDIVKEQNFNRSISSPPESSRKVDIEIGSTIEFGSTLVMEPLRKATDESTDEDRSPSEDDNDLESVTSCASEEIFNQVPDCESQYVGFASNLGENHLLRMSDVILAVKAHSHGKVSSTKTNESDLASPRSSSHLEILSLPTASNFTAPAGLTTKSPCFALRVLVKERLAKIIAMEIAGARTSVAIQDDGSLTVEIAKAREVADRWMIPKGARHVFRAVAFEALLFSGEKALLSRGEGALLEDLKPDEFHRIFSPLVAQMGDAETLEGWLASTDLLASRLLKRTTLLTPQALSKGHQQVLLADKNCKMPVSQATAFNK